MMVSCSPALCQYTVTSLLGVVTGTTLERSIREGSEAFSLV